MPQWERCCDIFSLICELGSEVFLHFFFLIIIGSNVEHSGNNVLLWSNCTYYNCRIYLSYKSHIYFKTIILYTYNINFLSYLYAFYLFHFHSSFPIQLLPYPPRLLQQTWVLYLMGWLLLFDWLSTSIFSMSNRFNDHNPYLKDNLRNEQSLSIVDWELLIYHIWV